MGFSFDEYRAALKAARHPEHINKLRAQMQEDPALSEDQKRKLSRLADKREGKR